MEKTSDYPTGMDYDIEVTSAKPATYFGNWTINEKPTCPFTPKKFGVKSEVKDGNKRSSVAFTIHN
jgi:hypothetical protein